MFELQAFGSQHVLRVLHRDLTYRRSHNKLRERRRDGQPAPTQINKGPFRTSESGRVTENSQYGPKLQGASKITFMCAELVAHG